jgi:hypothetical protein
MDEPTYLERQKEDMSIIFIKSRFAGQVATSMTFYVV